LRQRTIKIFEDIEFGGEIRLKSTIFKEKFVLIPKQIHKVVINVANLDPCKDTVFLPPIQDKEIVLRG